MPPSRRWIAGTKKRRRTFAPGCSAADHSSGLAHAELKGRIAAEGCPGPVAEALDESQSAERDQQRQLLREDAPDLEWRDDDVLLGVGRKVPRPARHLRERIV